MKRTKANDADTLYIKSNPDNLDAATISKKLDLKIEVVRHILDEVPTPKGHITTARPSATQFNNAIVKRRGAVIMTQTAAEIADATRTKGPPPKSYICKPLGDK